MILPQTVYRLKKYDALELAEFLLPMAFSFSLIDLTVFVVDQLGQTLLGEPIERFAL